MNLPHLILLIVLSAAAMVALAAEPPRGLWLTARKDAANLARADVPARMAEAPEEIWRCVTGGEVQYARTVQVEGEAMLLAQVGGTLQLHRWSGQRVWQRTQGGIDTVLRVDDFDGDGIPEAFVRIDARTVALLDLADGRTLWSWQTAPSTFISGHAFYPVPGGLRFICFPAYATDGYCFDFAGHRTAPVLRWQHSYAGKYDAGYGPSVVLRDMNGDGTAELVISGKKDGVYQAVLDAATGDVLSDVRYHIGGECGRPYGLLQAADLLGDGRPDIVMLACQVEEYAAVAQNDTGTQLRAGWGKFIEKDWPTDEKELRPQVTSVSDLQGTGRLELVVGVWEGGAWRTVVMDPARGFDGVRGEVAGRYFWGCYDITGDGRPEIIVSREAQRRTARCTTLEALDGKTLQPVAVLPEAAIFTSADSPLPPDRFFMALRRNPVAVTTADGAAGILVRRFAGDRDDGVFLWGGAPVTTRRVAGAEFIRADVQANGLLLSDGQGRVQRFDTRLRPVGKPLALNGRLCRPLVWVNGGKRELVFDAAGGHVRGGTPDLRQPGTLNGGWTVPGTMPALHLDAAGVSRLAVADTRDPDHPRAVIYASLSAKSLTPVTVPLAFPPYLGLTPFGREYRLLVNLQTGVHTMALACYDADGTLRWQDEKYGAHPQMPGAADVTGDGQPEVIADDHGVLRVHGADGAVVGAHPGWPPAYTLPIIGPFGADGAPAILRASGIWGLTLNDAQGKLLWERKLTQDVLFRWSYCLAAVGDMNGQGQYGVGLLADDGTFECFDARTGQPCWSLALDESPKGTSIIAGDVDGDGADEFLLALPSGRVLCLDYDGGKGRVRWELRLDAAAAHPILADIDGDGNAELIVSVADGSIRIFK